MQQQQQQQADGAWAGATQQEGLPGQQGQADDGQPRNLWVGELQYWMDENYLWNCFAHTGDLQAVKIIRNKGTGQSEGYGFAEFGTHATALHVLQTYNGAQMPQTEQPFRINWASFGARDQQRPRAEVVEHSIFVGDLANDVTDYMLTETFRVRYPSTTGAKVVIDLHSGRSKGYGFVRFASEEERDRALAEMNGQYCSSRPMRISVATPKRPGGPPGGPAQGSGAPRGSGAAPYAQPQPQGEEDPANTTVFVGGLDSAVTEDELRAVFAAYGELVYVKIPFGKGCGFVQFLNRANAEAAIHNLHGTQIGSQAVRLSWGRNPSAKRAAYQQGGWQQQDQSQYAAGYYGQGAAYGGYDASGYGAADGYGYGGYPAYGGGYGYPQQQWPQPQTPPPSQSAPTPQTTSSPNVHASHGPAAGASSSAAPAPAPPSHFDPMQPPNVDKMNAHYMAKTESSLLPHNLLLKSIDSVYA